MPTSLTRPAQPGRRRLLRQAVVVFALIGAPVAVVTAAAPAAMAASSAHHAPKPAPTPPPAPPTPALAFSPASLTFPNTEVGATSAAQTVTITNTSSAPVTITSTPLYFEGAKVSDGCSGTVLAAGASCSVSVTFTPAGAGPANGALDVVDSQDLATPQYVFLTANGLGIDDVSNLFETSSVTNSDGSTTVTLFLQLEYTVLPGDISTVSLTTGPPVTAPAQVVVPVGSDETTFTVTIAPVTQPTWISIFATDDPDPNAVVELTFEILS